jgi:hypothetical protein
VQVTITLVFFRGKAINFIATTRSIRGDYRRDLRVTAAEYRFGQVDRLPVTIRSLSENGSHSITAIPIAAEAPQRTQVFKAYDGALTLAKGQTTVRLGALHRYPRQLKPSKVAPALGQS